MSSGEREKDFTISKEEEVQKDIVDIVQQVCTVSKEEDEQKQSEKTIDPESSENCCWICFGTKDLVATEVCYCKGNDSYVHIDCLMKWIQTSGKTKCCKCNYEYDIKKEYSYKFLAYFSPFVSLVLVSLTIIGLFHYVLCSLTDIQILSVSSFRFLFYEIDILAMLLIAIAFSYVNLYTLDDQQHSVTNGSLLDLLSKMFSEDFHLTGLEIMLLYNVENNLPFHKTFFFS